jgi:hypothetical protein
VFGFEPGADYKLATYDQSIAYFKTLAAASKYVKLFEAGKTTQGRTMYFALISSPENLDRIERYRQIAQRLAHPQLTEDHARELAREGKAFVHLDGGLHSTEVAGSQQTPLLAYDLVRRAAEPEIKLILDNVVAMVWPTINPDGQQLVSEWYMRNVGSPYELSQIPRLYQEYVGHDNNRDGYMLNMIESRVVEQAWRTWEPQISYTQHQSGPFPTRIWLPPFSEPVAVEAPPLIAREINMIGTAIARELDEHGQPGATEMGTSFDAWYPGYLDYAGNFKNIASFWTETALYQYATPHTYTLDDFPRNMRDLRPLSMYSSPWTGGTWRLRDAVDYMETASLAVLEFAAKYKESVLFDRYKAGREQIARGGTVAPFAYVVPRDQRDPVAAVELLRRLAFAGVRVSRLDSAATIEKETFPAGTWVIPTDQEFAALAREVMDVQKYPDLRQYPNGPPERPYDVAGWTLPLQMGVRVVSASTPLDEATRAKLSFSGPSDAPVRPTPYDPDLSHDAAPFDSVPGLGFNSNPAAAAIVPPPGKIDGSGPDLAIDPAQNNAYRAINRAWEQGATVRRSADRLVVTGLASTAQQTLVNHLALRAERTKSAAGTPVERPRIGVFEPWSGSSDTGWTRWVLEQYGFPFVTVRPEDFKSPLKVDVIVFADDARVPVEGDHSGRSGGGRANEPRAVRPEYSYTLTPDDIRGFEAFVRGGGTIVCLNNASTFAIQQLKLPVKNVVAGLRPEDFFLRGSIVQVSIETANPIMAGMTPTAAVFADSSPVFDTQEGFEGTVLARYQDAGSPLLSGFLIGEQHLAGKAAALDVKLDAGHVVLLGFRPQWRGQAFGTFKILFNALLR